jgi:DNA-binding NarL/FixJ family response regulator
MHRIPGREPNIDWGGHEHGDCWFLLVGAPIGLDGHGRCAMRVVIVADSLLAAESVRRCLRSVPTFRIVGFVSTSRSGAATVSETAPDLVVVDGMDAAPHTLDRVQEIREALPDVKLVMLTRDADDAWLATACHRGLDAAVSVSVGVSGIGNLVRQVALGAIFNSFPGAGDRAKAVATPSPHTELLTARELEILRLVASGASNCQVAAELWVTEQTVKFHLSNTYRKLGVANRTQASHFAHTHGLLADGPAPTPAGPSLKAVAA